MKKKSTLYILLLSVLGLAVIFIVLKYKKTKTTEDTKIYSLLERTGPDKASAEWTSVKAKVDGYTSTLETLPTDVKSNLELAATFIQEARITGNHMYYDQAAMKHVNDVLKKEPENFSALCYKSLIYLSQHHFTEALETAKQAQQINPNNAFIYGLLTDAYVELGNYSGAIEMSDKMQSVKPDIRSYSRVSYLREIHGDYPGAIEAMKLAVSAGPPGTEGTEWARVQLGHLYEKTGDMKKADSTYSLSLDYRPGYGYAYNGLARVAAFNKSYDQSIQYYLKADSLVTDNTFKEELAELYYFLKKDDEANKLTKGVINDLNKSAVAADADNDLGHYSDNELALNYLKIGDIPNALKHAQLEYNRRPENISVNETMAWVYYKQGDNAKAATHIKTALKTNSKNPDLLMRAALIFNKAGDKAMAKKLFQQSLVGNPNSNMLLRNEASAIAQSL